MTALGDRKELLCLMRLHFLAVTEVSILKNFYVTRTELVVKMCHWLCNKYQFISSYLDTSAVNLLQRAS